MYTLYSIPGSCSTGITVLLKKLGVDFKTVNRDDVPNYSKIVPTNQVPALDHNGHVLTEGAAIVLYLLEKHGQDMIPTDVEEKAEFIKWLMFDYSTLHPAYSKLFTIAGVMEDSAEKGKLMQQLADKTSDTWKIIDERLATHEFIVGSEATIIDYLIAIYTSWNNYFPDINIVMGENVQDLVTRVTALPEFQAAYECEKSAFKAAA